MTENKFYSLPIDKQQLVNKEVQLMEERDRKLMARVETITPIHEDIIVIQKIDALECRTSLKLAPNSNDRLRLSFYGRILKVSECHSGDDVKELKKRNVHVGDIIQFNPDSGYSLNITIPEQMPELWIISIDNILCVDKSFDPIQTKQQTLIAQYS